MGMAYLPPEPIQIHQSLNRAERRALITFARTRRIGYWMKRRLEALSILTRYHDGLWDWTSIGARVWYLENERLTKGQPVRKF